MRGDLRIRARPRRVPRQDFYSRPCVRGDILSSFSIASCDLFLLTPLREGRPIHIAILQDHGLFLLTPLREGRQNAFDFFSQNDDDFYSRPCVRGDLALRRGLARI